MKIPAASIILGSLSGLIFFIGLLTLFGARGVMLQIVAAMLIFVMSMLLLVGAVLAFELWKMTHSLERRRVSYERGARDNQAA